MYAVKINIERDNLIGAKHRAMPEPKLINALHVLNVKKGNVRMHKQNEKKIYLSY